MNRKSFVDSARSYIGTPFHHQGRLPQVGLDCGGVIVCAATENGYEISDIVGYANTPALGMLERAVLEHCDVVPLEEVQDGDIMLFKFLREPQHLAVYSGGMLIHAYQQVGKVVENSFDDTWRKRLVACYSLRGIQ